MASEDPDGSIEIAGWEFVSNVSPFVERDSVVVMILHSGLACVVSGRKLTEAETMVAINQWLIAKDAHEVRRSVRDAFPEEAGSNLEW